MKPNDKAIEAGVKLCWDCPRATPSMIRDILTAAYAAQFPPSEDYAGLVKWLRDKAESLSEIYPPEAEAADALEVVLAERDDWKKTYYFTANKLDHAEEYAKKIGEENEALRTERDALLARLAPKDDKALVEIAVTAIHKEAERGPVFGGNLIPAVVAAIRPHIEAAEREKCAKIAEEGEDGSCWTASERAIAAAIRSGK